MWDTFTITFYGFLRVSEFTESVTDSTTLQWSDTAITLFILIRQPKTDPFCKGNILHIAATGATSPVKAMLQYSSMISSNDISGCACSRPAFTSVMHTR